MQYIDHVPEGWRIFELEDGRKFVGRKNCCLFCRHCTDIFYDYTNGIYATICEAGEEPENGMSGKCKCFEEAKND